MTKEELAQKIKDSNYTCEGISCDECIKVNGYGCCLQEDRKLFVSLVLPEKNNLKKDNLEKQVEILKQENAELKEKLNKLERKCHFNFTDLLHDVDNEIKAKQIIKKLLDFGLCDSCLERAEEEKELREQAEQFLRDNE